jgi:hypothetical protein
MVKLILHSDSISERGDSVNAEGLSSALRLFKGIESLIVYNIKSESNKQNRIDELISSGHQVISYTNSNELHSIGKTWGATHSYFFGNGAYSPLWIKNTKKLTHAVFNNYEPHGDKYNYVSEWLYRKALRSRRRSTTENRINELRELSGSPYTLNTKMPISWVPHIVESKDGDGVSFRKKHNIPVNSKMIGRIGGYNQFDDTVAQKSVIELVEKFKDYFFVFINTKKFNSHPRIIHIEYLSSDEKWDFYSAGDVFINGRLMGESFGFSICEALSVGKPIVAPNFHRNFRMDKHHISILNRQGLLYKSKKEFKNKVIQQINNPTSSQSLAFLVEQFRPQAVADIFAERFLDLNRKVET